MQNNLFRITLDTNPEDCNLKCIMCEEHSEFSDYISNLKKLTGVSKRRMPVDFLDKIFKEAKQLGCNEIIPSTMGEPLLYSHFDKIIELCIKNNILLNLTTNGTFPKKKIGEWSKILIPICSDIKISFNGIKSVGENIMKGIDFDKIIFNIKSLVEYRDIHFEERKKYTSISFQMTFLKSNISDLKNILDKCYELGIDRLKGHHLWAHFEEIKNLSIKNNFDSILEWNEAVNSIHKYNLELSISWNRKVKLENFTEIEFDERFDSIDKNCPFLDKELWVSATGKISPCCAPDKLRDTLGDFGNIQTHSLCDVLNSNQYKDLLANYKTNNLCSTCNMRK